MPEGDLNRATPTPTPHRVPRALESGKLDSGWITFVQDTDPAGAVVGGSVGQTFWVDTSGGSGNYVLNIRNAADTGWEPL